jgi:hypothetical protein
MTHPAAVFILLAVSVAQRVVGRIDPSLTVTTVGFGCATAEGGLVEVQRDLARVVPYDRVPEAGHDTLCGERIVTLLPRDLRVTLPQAGAANLRVVGLSASTPEEVLDSVDVAISVLP